jgi:hypothetical protein
MRMRTKKERQQLRLLKPTITIQTNSFLSGKDKNNSTKHTN